MEDLATQTSRYSGRRPVVSPRTTRCKVMALMTAAPRPEPSAARVMTMGSCFLFLGQSKISPIACAHLDLKRRFLTTKRSAATWPDVMPFFRQIAAIPHVQRRAPRVAMSSLARRQRMRSGSVRVMLRPDVVAGPLQFWGEVVFEAGQESGADDVGFVEL
jgi:hypothetical protein